MEVCNEYIHLISERRDILTNDFVILTDERHGTWIKIPRDCYDHILNADRNEISKADFLLSFENIKDRSYMKDLLDILVEAGFFKEEKNVNQTKIQKITLCVTNRCNLRCLHCSVNANSTAKGEFSTAELKEVINKVIECNPQMIAISGGEPLVRGDFCDFSTYLRSQFNGQIMLMTNGTRILDREAEFISKCYDEISVSLDGYNVKTCDFIRGEGTFNRTIEAIRLLKMYGCAKISTSMVMCGQNTDTIRQFKKLNAEMGTKEIFRMLAPIGRAGENYDLLINSEQGKFIRESMEEKAIIDFEQRVIGSTTVCDAISKQICIGADGTIYPCAGAQLEEFGFGNIRDVDSLLIYLTQEEYKKRREYQHFVSLSPSKSEPCNHCIYNVACFGCPVYLYLYKKNGTFEAFCSRQKNRLIGGGSC